MNRDAGEVCRKTVGRGEGEMQGWGAWPLPPPRGPRPGRAGMGASRLLTARLRGALRAVSVGRAPVAWTVAGQ